MMYKDKNQKGFTIIELMIAITIFSMVLLICAAAIIYLGRAYYKGSLTSRTQETSRNTIEDISQSVQFGVWEGEVQSEASGGYQTYCLGGTRYTYSTNTARTDSNHVLWRDQIAGNMSGCPVANFSEPSGVELLGDNMRLPQFEIIKNGEVVQVNLLVVYGDELDLFKNNDPQQGCISSDVGGQFCAVSSNSTTIVKRL